MSTLPPFLTDEEIFAIVDPLTQPAAIVRWFKANDFPDVKVRPNGLPLVARAYFDQVQRTPTANASTQPDIAAFRQKHGRKLRVVSAKV